MSPDLNRLQTLLERLHNLELCIPLPHERPIVDVARTAVAEQIRTLSQGLMRGDYLRPEQKAKAAIAG